MPLTSELTQISPSAFDEHHPPSAAIIDTCVHCGFCLQACPTYVLWGQEMDSPRGRIYLMKTAADGTTAINSQWVQHFDTCLGCMSCSTACPSGVDYGQLIEATRAQIERRYRRSWPERLYRQFLFKVFTSPKLLSWLRWPLLAYQKSGLRKLLHRVGALKLLPRRLQAMESLMPDVEVRREMMNTKSAHGPARARVGLILGCVQREFLPEINAATVRVLTAEGCDVIAPGEQGCCGALLLHAGEENRALVFARRMIDLFERAGVDTIIVNAGGCGSSLKEYGHLLRDDPEYAERARRFAAKCEDITEFLARIEPQAIRHSLPSRVAYHDSCHLQHAQRVRTQPRALLSQIPQLQLLEVPEASICCGSAGIYNLVQPTTADALGDRKAQLIAPLGADLVATGNPGCILQLRSALARSGREVPVLHTIQLLDASIRGLTY
jgi:glycolate oxidase iron-sulfur subunit